MLVSIFSPKIKQFWKFNQHFLCRLYRNTCSVQCFCIVYTIFWIVLTVITCLRLPPLLDQSWIHSPWFLLQLPVRPTGAPCPMQYGRTPLLNQRYADDFCSLVFLAVNKIIWNGINPSQIVFDAHFISKTAGNTNGLKTRTSFKLSYDLKHKIWF